MTKDLDIAKELAELRREVERLRDTVARVAGGPPSGRVAGRIRTFVDGLDEALEGGIPAGHVVILSGPSGSMKTSIALHALHRNEREGLRGLYISLEEGRASLVRTMERLGMPGDDDFIVDIAKLRMEHKNAEGVGDWLQVLKDYLGRRMERDRIGLLVIDPLNSLHSLAEFRNPRRDLFQFFTYLRSLGLTSLVITEAEGPDPFPDHETFIADGAIQLSYFTDPEGHVDLRIRCVKMRHTNHSRDFLRLEFQDGRFRARRMDAP